MFAATETSNTLTTLLDTPFGRMLSLAGVVVGVVIIIRALFNIINRGGKDFGSVIVDTLVSLVLAGVFLSPALLIQLVDTAPRVTQQVIDSADTVLGIPSNGTAPSTTPVAVGLP